MPHCPCIQLCLLDRDGEAPQEFAATLDAEK
jgi:hypothetical protein